MLKNKHYVYGENVQVPSHLNFGQEIFDKMLEYRTMTALINADIDRRLTYGELAQMTVDIALSLTRMGVRKGEVISICSEKRFEVMATILGIFCAGATFSPTDISYGAVPLVHRVKIARPKVMFCSSSAFRLHKSSFDSVGCIEKYIVYEDEGSELQDGSLLQENSQSKNADEIWYKEFLTETADPKQFMAVPVDGWKDHLFILFSSGTTGLPKGVPITHRGFVINSICITTDSFKDERLLNTREWYYTYGLMYTLACLKGGCTVVYSFRNTHADCLNAIQKYKIKFLQLTPTSVTELIKSQILDDYDTSSVEGIISSSMPISADQVQAVTKRLVNLKGVYQIYGLSEAGCACGELYAPLGPRHGSAGTPSHGFIFKVVDLKSRQALGPRERGEICFKSPSLTPGYLLVGDRDYMDEEGFYKTGDVGYYDEDNYFYIANRMKELIKYNDISIAPAELESILLQHPSVAEAGVVGAPSEELGEAPTAFVALQPGAPATEQELVDFLESRITFRMRLAGGVRFVDTLPLSAGGKLDRDKLKNML